jgi:hypothetical protein
MYRVLLKSMNLGAPDDLGIATHDGAAVKAWDGKQNENRAWNPTYLIGLPSTIDPAPLEPSFTVLPAASRLLF